VSGTRYSLDYIKATTFCSKEIEIDSKDDYIKIPKNLLDDTEIFDILPALKREAFSSILRNTSR